MAGQKRPGPPVVRHTIAVADDHIDVRELIALRMSMVPHLEVIGQAANGVEAINLARDRRPDVMTLDLQMPVMGGAAAISVLRALAPHMRIVVFSGHPEAIEMTKDNQPDAMVSKGANLADLVAVVTGLLAEGPSPDLVEIDLGRFPVHVAVDAFDAWVGLNARVRGALADKDDVSADLLGDVPIESSDLLCLMGVFMQFGLTPDDCQPEWRNQRRPQVLRAPGLRRRGKAGPACPRWERDAPGLQPSMVTPAYEGGREGARPRRFDARRQASSLLNRNDGSPPLRLVEHLNTRIDYSACWGRT